MNDWHQRMTGDLQLRGLSERTQGAYLRAVRKLAEHCGVPPAQLREQQIRDYLLHLKNDREFAPGSLRIALNGIKFFFRCASSALKRLGAALKTARFQPLL